MLRWSEYQWLCIQSAKRRQSKVKYPVSTELRSVKINSKIQRPIKTNEVITPTTALIKYVRGRLATTNFHHKETTASTSTMATVVVAGLKVRGTKDSRDMSQTDV